MCYKSDKDEMHHIIIEKLECLHHEIRELKEKMEFVGLKMKHMKENSCHAFEKLEGKLDCLEGMFHHEMEEMEDSLEDLCAYSSAMAQESECPCEECKEEESPAKK